MTRTRLPHPRRGVLSIALIATSFALMMIGAVIADSGEDSERVLPPFFAVDDSPAFSVVAAAQTLGELFVKDAPHAPGPCSDVAEGRCLLIVLCETTAQPFRSVSHEVRVDQTGDVVLAHSLVTNVTTFSLPPVETLLEARSRLEEILPEATWIPVEDGASISLGELASDAKWPLNQDASWAFAPESPVHLSTLRGKLKDAGVVIPPPQAG